MDLKTVIDSTPTLKKPVERKRPLNTPYEFIL
ncbi:Uncharacterised protein [Acinetobacter johnsonii]|uniref:Uncharacterized protein n=1 Tax=Acinetobacter johnsonii TaxID=40214 RepID=A0A380U889_ACIJO|nr:hypothetical protein F986_03327 [Acinetobacter johnsonii CIP 64.6]SUT97731.1 Uncharacterised protein [Acinetobacter johnsonii]